MAPSVGQYLFAVVSLDPNTNRPQESISHYVFANINDANRFCEEQNSDTSEKSVVLMLRKMNNAR